MMMNIHQEKMCDFFFNQTSILLSILIALCRIVYYHHRIVYTVHFESTSKNDMLTDVCNNARDVLI